MNFPEVFTTKGLDSKDKIAVGPPIPPLLEKHGSCHRGLRSHFTAYSLWAPEFKNHVKQNNV